MISYDMLDVRNLADEWEAVPDDPDYDDEHEKYGQLCQQLGIDGTPEALRRYGDDYDPTLIRDGYFETYARELADELGIIPKQDPWPLYCIDWEYAARELRFDYTSVDFDGISYYTRAI